MEGRLIWILLFFYIVFVIDSHYFSLAQPREVIMKNFFWVLCILCIFSNLSGQRFLGPYTGLSNTDPAYVTSVESVPQKKKKKKGFGQKLFSDEAIKAAEERKKLEADRSVLYEKRYIQYRSILQRNSKRNQTL